MRAIAHIIKRDMKLSPIRAIKALVSVARLARDPSRLNEVFEIADAVSDPATLDGIIRGLSKDPKAARSFIERHRIKVDLAALQRLPEGTLGRVFSNNMIAQGLDPSALPDVPSPDARSYFHAHMYETHDIWHAVTGFAVDPVGELGLQAFYLAQIKGRLPSMLLATGFARVAIFQHDMAPKMMDSVARGWRMGNTAKPFFGTHWDDLWAKPIAEVRRQFGIEDADVAASGVVALAA